MPLKCGTWKPTGHTRRVAQLTMGLVDRMGLPEEDKVHIRRGAILHDIGKIGVPDHILMKRGKFTDDEWEDHEIDIRYWRMKC